jgi:uncharacterized protein YegP (UPF0339 family)
MRKLFKPTIKMATNSKIKKYRFEIWKSDEDGKWYWHMIAVMGGKTVLQSQDYTRSDSARATVISIASCFRYKPVITVNGKISKY